MEMENSKPEEMLVPIVDLASSAPETVVAPVATVPAVKAAPAVISVSVPAVKTELPKTTGQTVGGWNRFAGYNPNAAKNKSKDGRGGPGRK